MNLKPEYREKLSQALGAFIIVVISVILSMVGDALLEAGRPPIDVSPLPAPEAIVALGTTHFSNIEAGDITATGLLRAGFADLTVTNGYTLTPTVNVYALDSAGAVTITLAADAEEGQILILIGDDANNVTIADTNLRSHDGNALVLGQYDVAMLVYQDSEWIQLVELANQ